MNLSQLDPFKGQDLQHAEDKIEAIAKASGFSVNILQPSAGISGNIDVEPNRLNVWVDADFNIYKYTVG
jgi:hypothetical protein